MKIPKRIAVKDIPQLIQELEYAVQEGYYGWDDPRADQNDKEDYLSNKEFEEMEEWAKDNEELDAKFIRSEGFAENLPDPSGAELGRLIDEDDQEALEEFYLSMENTWQELPDPKNYLSDAWDRFVEAEWKEGKGKDWEPYDPNQP